MRNRAILMVYWGVTIGLVAAVIVFAAR